jgi:hypothetical protein
MKIEFPSDEYEKAYRTTVLRAKAGLGEQLFPKVSSLQFSYLGEEYRSAATRVMVMGQETYGVYSSLDGDLAAGGDWYERRAERARAEFEKFNYGIGTSVERSPFWRGYDEVVRAFDLSGRSSIAWSNLVKVQLVDHVGGSFSISKLSPEERMKIVRWQRDLALAEIEYAKPHVIVMLTGALTWVASHLYSSPHAAVELAPIPGLSSSSGQIKAAPFNASVVAFTYHPAALRSTEGKAKVTAERSQVIAWARAQSSEREFVK